MKSALISIGIVLSSYLFLSLSFKGRTIFESTYPYTSPVSEFIQDTTTKVMKFSYQQMKNFGEMLFHNAAPGPKSYMSTSRKQSDAVETQQELPHETIRPKEKEELNDLIKNF